jgi:hypothetical protein
MEFTSGRKKPVENLWEQFCGCFAAAPSGGCCRRIEAIGTLFTNALSDGGDKGVWDAMHAHFANDPDMESIMIDGTIVRAHACAAGAPQKQLDEPKNQALGRSKGGFTTKFP